MRLQDEVVIIGKARSDHAPTGLGSGSREERYRLDIIVSVAGPVRTPHQLLEERAFVLAGILEASITAWRTEANPYNGLVAWAVVDSMISDENIAEAGDSREATVSMGLVVVGRI